MKNFFVISLLLCAYTIQAQTNYFKLTDTILSKNAVYRCPMLDFYNGCNNTYAKIKIDSIKNFLQANPSVKIQIRCHTDQRGSAEYNKLLTEKYALRLKEAIVDSTITEDRITSIGFGESKPLIDIKTIESFKTYAEKERAYEKNRRLEILITDL